MEHYYRNLLITFVVFLALSGCASVPDPYEPQRAFKELPLLEAAVQAPDALPTPPRPRQMDRVESCAGEGCYRLPALADDQVAVYTAAELSALMDFIEHAQGLDQASQATVKALVARKEEINALIRLGRLTEAQQMILVEQTKFFEAQYRFEWWKSTGLSAILLYLGVR